MTNTDNFRHKFKEIKDIGWTSGDRDIEEDIVSLNLLAYLVPRCEYQ